MVRKINIATFYLNIVIIYVALSNFNTVNAQVMTQSKYMSVKIEPVKAKLSDYYDSKFTTGVLEQTVTKIDPLKPPPINVNSYNHEIRHLENLGVSESQISDMARERAEKLSLEKDNLLERICYSMQNTLSKHSIPVSENNPDIVLIVDTHKIVHITYLNNPIIENILVIAKSNVDGRELFKVEFLQQTNYIDLRFWKVLRTPEQIGIILGKRITKEIRRLQTK